MEVLPFRLEQLQPAGALRWLVLGKGPSSSAYQPVHADTYDVLALNHAMRGQRVRVGHTLDIEVIEQIDAAQLAGVEYLCLPWLPHVRQQRPFYAGRAYFGPGALTLRQCAERSPVLRDYLERGRLLSYNFSTAPASCRHPGLPSIEGSYSFSAAVATRLLAQSGATEIRTLGVDGGSQYGAGFADLAERTRLQTAQTTYDLQFQQIADTMNQFDVLSGPLDAQLPAQVFVGCMPEQELAYRVLEYSIRRHASVSVTVQRLHDAIAARAIVVPVPVAVENRGGTSFSFQRFAIPALRHYGGRAIYIDSDMLVLRDVRQLWTFDMQGRQMVSAAQPPGGGRPPQFSVMLIDCERLRWDVADVVQRLDAGQYDYAQLMHEMRSVASWSDALPETWNSLEHWDPARTCLVHFTDMDGQPWLNPLHPLGALWAGYLLDAVRSGAIDAALVAQEVARGNVRPSLLEQLARGEADPRRLPFGVLRRDLSDFQFPHRRGGPPMSRMKHELYRTREFASHLLAERLVGSTVRRARRLASSMVSRLSR